MWQHNTCGWNVLIKVWCMPTSLRILRAYWYGSKQFGWHFIAWKSFIDLFTPDYCESRTGDSTRPPIERKCKEIFELIDPSANVSGNKGIAVTWGAPMQQIHGQGQAQKFLVEMLGNSLLGFPWALHTTMCFLWNSQIKPIAKDIEYKTWASSSCQELTLCLKQHGCWKEAKH
jgi:hypothetical protein